jgi:Flp pilus assembly protein TadB
MDEKLFESAHALIEKQIKDWQDLADILRKPTPWHKRLLAPSIMLATMTVLMWSFGLDPAWALRLGAGLLVAIYMAAALAIYVMSVSIPRMADTMIEKLSEVATIIERIDRRGTPSNRPLVPRQAPQVPFPGAPEG